MLPETHTPNVPKGRPCQGNPSWSTELPTPSTYQQPNTFIACDNGDVVDALAGTFGVIPSNKHLPSRCQNYVVALASYMKEGNDRPTVPQIAERAGMSERTAQRAARDLKKAGFLWVTYRKRGPRSNYSNVYRVSPRGKVWDRPRSLRQPSRPSLYGDSSVTVFLPSSIASGGDNPLASPSVVPTEVAAPSSPPPSCPASDVVALPEGEEGVKVASGEKDAGEPSLDDVMGPSQKAVSPVRKDVDPMVAILRVREVLETFHLGHLKGGGFESRLIREASRAHLSLEKFLPLVMAVGDRLAKLVDAAKAEGKAHKADGPVEMVRGYVVKCIRGEDWKVKHQPHVPLREPRPFRAIALRDFRPHRDPMPETPDREAPTTRERPASSECAKRVLAVLQESQHGYAPLAGIATPENATRLAQRSEDAACGGKLTTEDLLTAIRRFALTWVSRMHSGALLPDPGAMMTFLNGYNGFLPRVTRGSAEAMQREIAGWRLYKKKLDLRQPGTLDHLAAARLAKSQHVPTKEETQAQADRLYEMWKERSK